jgi:hypothetical protein
MQTDTSLSLAKPRGEGGLSGGDRKGCLLALIEETPEVEVYYTPCSSQGT